MHLTILFMHGMDGHMSSTYLRATLPSVRNVLTLDDRGFADLTGKPNEAGLTIDTRAAWDWLRARGASSDSMLAV